MHFFSLRWRCKFLFNSKFIACNFPLCFLLLASQYLSRSRVGTLSSSSGTIVQCGRPAVLYLVSCSCICICICCCCLRVCQKVWQIRLDLLWGTISIWHLVKQTSQSKCFINYNNNKKKNNNNLNFNCFSNCVCILYLCLLLLQFIVCLSCLRVNFHFHLAFEFAFATDKLTVVEVGAGCGRGSAHSFDIFVVVVVAAKFTVSLSCH